MNDLFTICAESALPTDNKKPDWVHLLPSGVIKGRDGRTFILGDPDKVIGASMRGADMPVDYEHQIDVPAQRPQDGVVKAAGWIKELEMRADGIWGRVEWTETALNMIKAKEYRYISPALIYDSKSLNVTRLVGASLVHRPNLNLTALNQEQAGGASAISAIALALGLNAEASSDQIVAAISERVSPDPRRYVPIEVVKELMQERRETLHLMSEQDAEMKVVQAMSDGHLTPAMKPWAIALCREDPKSFDEFLASSAAPFAHLAKPREWPALRPGGDSPKVTGDLARMAEQLDIDLRSLR